MSLSVIDKYISENLQDLDLYSECGDINGDIKNYAVSEKTNSMVSSNGSSNSTKRQRLYNTKLRNRDSLELRKKYRRMRLNRDVTSTVEDFDQYKVAKENENKDEIQMENENRNNNHPFHISEFYGNKDHKSQHESHKDSLVISKDNDRIYDYYNNRKAAIHYKRYGQFLSLSNDASPDEKYIIDMFDLYQKLHTARNCKPKKKSFFKSLKNIFNLSS